MRTDRLEGAILAAGRGTRMQPFSDEYPKPLLPICGKPLIQYQIETMASLGIRRIFIVIGHNGFRLVQALGTGDTFGVALAYVEQTDQMGIAHALGRLEPHVSAPFLVFLGDIFFTAKDPGKMLRLAAEDDLQAVLATKVEEDAEAIRRNFTVNVDDDGLVRRVIEKPRHVKTHLKGCGLYLFDLHVFDAIRRTPRTAMRDEYEITNAIQIMVDDGCRIKCANVVEADLNLTVPSDLLAVNLEQLKRNGCNRHIAEDAQVIDLSKIRDSVVGRHTVVKRPIRIESSVIFDGTVVDTERNIRNCVLTPTQVVQCAEVRIPA